MPTFLHNNATYSEYVKPDRLEITRRFAKIQRLVLEFANVTKIDTDQLVLNLPDLVDTIIRVDQRGLHYKLYHKIRMNEFKEIATVCYWILKYKPLSLIIRAANGDVNRSVCSNFKINEYFCLYIITCTIERNWIQNGKQDISLPEGTSKAILYDLTHRSISYDSLATLVDSIAQTN